MLQWLRRFWTSATPAVPVPESPDLFQPRERNIYRYFNGQQVVAQDPMILYRRMKDVSTDLEVDFKVARSPMKDADAAAIKAVARIRGIFDLKPFNEGGLTEKECLELLRHFWDYSGGVKKNSPPPGTDSGGTSDGSTPPTAPVPDGTPPTSPTSGSGSTASANTTTPPREPTSVPASPGT